MTRTPIDLFARALRLAPDGGVHDQVFSRTGEPAGWQLAAFHAGTDEDVHADHWEIHPCADEAVCCLTGAVRLFLAAGPDTPEEEVRLTAGTACVVPRGRRHRIELDEPSDLLSVTLPAGTRLEPVAR